MRLSEDYQMQDPGDESTFLYVIGLVITAVASAGGGIVAAWLTFRGKVEQIRSNHESNVVTGITATIASEHNRMEKFYEDLMEEVSLLRRQNMDLIRKVNELNQSNVEMKQSNVEMKSQIHCLEREVEQMRVQLSVHEGHHDETKPVQRKPID